MEQVGASRKAFYPGKSEREKAIEQTGVGASLPFHSAADYAARRAVMERGLGTSVRESQAAQWGEEQIKRGIVRHSEAYPTTRETVSQSQFKLI